MPGWVHRPAERTLQALGAARRASLSSWSPFCVSSDNQYEEQVERGPTRGIADTGVDVSESCMSAASIVNSGALVICCATSARADCFFRRPIKRRRYTPQHAEPVNDLLVCMEVDLVSDFCWWPRFHAEPPHSSVGYRAHASALKRVSPDSAISFSTTSIALLTIRVIGSTTGRWIPSLHQTSSAAVSSGVTRSQSRW